MNAVSPPETFVTDRLRLRRPRMSDAGAVLRYGSDPEVVRYMTWPRHSGVDTVEAWLARCAQAWSTGEEFSWLLTLPPEDEAIGTVACCVRGAGLDFGFVLSRSSWGRGLATEAARAVVQWGWAVPTIRRIWATCDAENVASMRVLEKAGLCREGLLRGGLVRPNLGPEPRATLVYAMAR